MFDNDRYIIRPIKEVINLLHYLLRWELLGEIGVEKKDYCKWFTLSVRLGTLREGYLQYSPIHKFFTVILVSTKVYVSDDW